MAVRKRKRTGSWVAYWRDPGTRKQHSKSFGPGPAGEAAARELDANRPWKNRRKPKTDGGPLVVELAEYYFTNHALTSNNARDHLEIRLEANLMPFFGRLHAAQLTFTHLNKYINHRRTIGGVKNSTINRELNDLQAILNFAADQRPPLIPFNPVKGFKKPPSDDAIIQPPSPNETAAILSVASPHMTRFIYLCMYLGARPGYREILTRKWDDVHWNRFTITVISARKGGAPVRQVPLHPVLEECLAAWYMIDLKKYGKGLVGRKGIVNYHGRSISKIGKAWSGTLLRAGITRRIRPYDLRHRFASDLLAQGEDIKTVSEIMGSAPTTILKHYQHVARPQHRAAISRNIGIQSLPEE
jgi:integrase